MKGARSSIGVLVDIDRNINCRLDITADVVTLGRRKIMEPVRRRLATRRFGSAENRLGVMA